MPVRDCTNFVAHLVLISSDSLCLQAGSSATSVNTLKITNNAEGITMEFAGEHFRIPRSFIQPKPVQKPHPPIYYAAFAPAAMRRVALEADGWNPAGLPVAAMGAMFQSMREMAEGAGRDPGALSLVVRANVWIGERPLSDPRMIFTGDADQIAADIAATRDLGADEVLFDAQPSKNVRSVDDLLAAGEQLLELAHRG